MTHNFLYILAGTHLDHDSKFFMVGVGESERMRKHQAWLEAYAFEHGHFFVRWTPDAVEFCRKCIDSVGLAMIDVKCIKAPELRKFLQTGQEEPAFYQSALNRHRLLMQIDSRYYFYSQINKSAKKTQAE